MRAALLAGNSPPGFLAALYYDSSLDRFVLMTRPSKDYSETTTCGLDHHGHSADGERRSHDLHVPRRGGFVLIHYLQYECEHHLLADGYQGNIDCETNPESRNGALSCLEKGIECSFWTRIARNATQSTQHLHGEAPAGAATESFPSGQGQLQGGQHPQSHHRGIGIAHRLDRSNGTHTGRAYKSVPQRATSTCQSAPTGVCATPTLGSATASTPSQATIAFEQPLTRPNVAVTSTHLISSCTFVTPYCIPTGKRLDCHTHTQD